ncbi:MAG: hypothetical protein ACYSX0_10840 [Planctomycetota bacterium]|jgi:hypothetical protein
MAGCDSGYYCDRCGEYVENVRDSELYLRYILGAVPLDQLRKEPERHLCCAPEFAQFIVDPGYMPVECADPAIDKRNLPVEVRERQERLFTKAWRRLQEVAGSATPVDEYPFGPKELSGDDG